VQLPYRSVVGSGAQDGEALRRARAGEQQARSKLGELEAELSKERQTRGKLSELEAELGKERQARSKDAELESELAKERQAVATRDAKLREAETRVFARDAELTALRQELEHKNQLIKTHEASVAELTAQLQKAPPPEEASTAANELAALEQALRERGEQIRKLERELRESERVGKELLRQLPLPASESAAVTVPKPENTESLAQQLAKSHADLVAMRWALEAAVRRGGSTPENPES
jgi:chromosome segregation ATPase